MFLMSKTGFSSGYDEGKGVYMHSVFFFLFQEIFNFQISTASISFELFSEIKQILALLHVTAIMGEKTRKRVTLFLNALAYERALL